MTFCVTLSASLAARLGPESMAAFQVCLQCWLATSLLADGLAVAGQVRSDLIKKLTLKQFRFQKFFENTSYVSVTFFLF